MGASLLDPSSAFARSTSNRVRAIARRAADLLFPWACLGCERDGREPVCLECLARVAWSSGAACLRCGIPFPSGPARPCGRCLERPPRFDRARAIVRYVVRAEGDDPVGRAVRAFKYGRRRGIGGFLARLLAERCPYAPGEHDVLVPVPLDLARLRERGFNQALILARGLARSTASRVEPRALERVRATRSQVELDETARRANLRGAIRVRRPEGIRGRRVLLVDDVLTTGATADACADALRRSGAAAVDVLAVARAPLR